MAFRDAGVAAARELRLRYCPTQTSERVYVASTVTLPLGVVCAIGAIGAPVLALAGVPMLVGGVAAVVASRRRGYVRMVLDDLGLHIEWPRGARHGTAGTWPARPAPEVQVRPVGPGFGIFLRYPDAGIHLNDAPSRAHAEQEALTVRRFLASR